MSKSSNDTSLTQMARTMLAQCKHPTVQPLNEADVPQVEEWAKQYERNPNPNASDIMSRAHARWLLATTKPGSIKDRLREYVAACIAVACIAEGRKEANVDVLLTEHDKEVRTCLTDAEALQAVEECGRKTQEAEDKTKELIASKEAVELELLQLQDAHKALVSKHQSLVEESERIGKAHSILVEENGRLKASLTQSEQANLNVSKVQVSNAAADPGYEGILEELKKHHVAIDQKWVEAYNARVSERHTTCDKTEQLLRAIQQDPGINAAIQKNPLLASAFELVAWKLPEIAS